MAQTNARPLPLAPANLTGSWRRFGAVGPVYQIIGEVAGLQNRDRVMRIRVLETGEEVNYKLAAILDDPKES